MFKKRACEKEIDSKIVAINPIPPQDGALPRREEKEPVHAGRKENEVEEQECELGEEDMKALTDILEALGENELPFSNPEPQTTSAAALTVSIPSTYVPMDDCFSEAQICATPVAIISACATPVAIDASIPAPTTNNCAEEEILSVCVSETQTYASPAAIIPIHYQPVVEPISPMKVKKGLKVKNPGFKKHRSFPFSSLPPYKGMSSRENPV